MALTNDPDHKDHFNAVRFYLRTKARDRGYADRIEHTGADGKDLSVRIQFVEATEADE